MSIDHATVQRWLDGYVGAWRSYDPAAIAALFAADATYAYHPWDGADDVVRGREAIVANWLAERDEPGSWEAAYRPLVVEGDRAVVTGQTRYLDDRPTYHNLWELRFDAEGRCRELVEWFMTRQPG